MTAVPVAATRAPQQQELHQHRDQSGTSPEPGRLILRWTARISALALVGLAAMFYIGNGLPNPLNLTITQTFQHVAFAATLLGLIAGWRWEWFGGGLAIIGLAGFNAIEYGINGHPAGGAFPYFAIPAVLYVLSAWSRRGRVRQAN